MQTRVRRACGKANAQLNMRDCKNVCYIWMKNEYHLVKQLATLVLYNNKYFIF